MKQRQKSNHTKKKQARKAQTNKWASEPANT